MRSFRYIQLVIMTAVFLAFSIPSDIGQTAGGPMGAGAKSDDGFKEMLRRVDAAQVELQNGRPAAYKALWSHADDITLSGGFGGTIEKGWPAVERRLDWVGTQFSNGTNRIDRVSASASGDLAYVVQAEHLRYTVPGASAP